MAIVYTPPGTSVTEILSPSVTPLLASPADICIIGVAGVPATSSQPITTTDTLILTGTTPVTLPTLAQLNSDAVLVSVVSVNNTLTPLASNYVITSDYTVTLGAAGPDGANGTITRVSAGTIPSGTLVTVTYTYLPSDYWNAIRLYDIGSVETRFGNSWATGISPSTGQTYYTGINSQLSMAARIAFGNGAQSVICQPLFARATPGNPTTAQQAPTATQVGQSATWADTLYSLRPYVDLDIIVPVVGQDGVNVSDSAELGIFEAIQSHLSYMNTQQLYIVAVLGEDGTSSADEAAGLLTTIRTHAASLQGNYGNALSSQMVLINNTVFQLGTPGGQNSTINVGGQYCAAAVAGAIGGRAVSQSLTNQPILGFQSISDPRVPADKNTDAGSGLMVIQQLRNGLIQCRQGITLDIIDGPARQELSVVRAKFMMMESIQQTINNQIIGNIIANGNSPFVVSSAISGVLTLLQQGGVIVGFANVQSALTSLTPTTITSSFTYQPAFPLNFVNITFSIDLSTNSITVTNDGTNPTTGT